MPRRYRTLPIALTLAALLAGCATHVEVAGQFPTPVTRRLPVSVTLVLEPAFRAYRLEVTQPNEVSLAVGNPRPTCSAPWPAPCSAGSRPPMPWCRRRPPI